jgi:starvation-inducible DNA-binding protein
MTTTRRSKSPARNGRQTDAASSENQPILNQKGREIQQYGTVRNLPIGLDAAARLQSCELLNQILADSLTLYHMYKKHHWQVSGHTFYQLHLLFDKHADEQLALIDLLAERIQLLGGIATGMPADVAQISRIENPAPGAEEVPVQISRLLEAHELICEEVREAIEKTEENKDWGTNDLLMGDVLRTNELQVWFLASHLVDEPLVRAGADGAED